MVKRTLKQHRVLKDMTQEELANECGISVKMISLYENDTGTLKKISYKKLLKICEVLDIKVDDIYLG